MNQEFLLLAVLLPLLGGALLPLTYKYGPKVLYGGVYAITAATSVLVWALIFTCETQAFTVVHLTKELTLTLRFDGLGRFFAGIVATLWPLTVLYASEYMKTEPRQTAFFCFFTMTYGVTLGVAMSANLFTMYAFYELLTLATVPLVMHPMTRRAVRAAKTYFSFSLGGAAFAFTSMMYLIGNGYGGDFRFGGFLESGYEGSQNLMLTFYVLGFLGFGVKAALFPTHVWLPKASVAPTPVTALLHAVAVVKSGAFAVIRLTWYAYGTKSLAGTWAQNLVMGFAIFTILFGSTKALKEQHWKRRLAYSTVANLSYILFGVSMMTQAGLAAGLLHMAFHAEIKILAFFCAGAVLHGTGREYLRQLNGLGKKMPITFGCFTVSALALTGIPPFSGFVSKWHLLTAAADSQNILAYVGAGALLFSALLTAMYMFTAVCRAFFPWSGSEDEKLPSEREVSWRMTVPMTILAAGILLTGLFAQPIVNAALAIAGGMG